MIYGNQMYTPYQQQYYPQQMQQQIPVQQQQSNLFGRVVNNFEELSVNDIPMNGSAAYFPKSDMSEIECRQWRNDGTIARTLFKPVEIKKADNVSNDDEKSLEKALNEFTDLFNERIDKLEKLIKPEKVKKEGEQA